MGMPEKSPFYKSVEKSMQKKHLTNLYVYETLISHYLENVNNYEGFTNRVFTNLFNNQRNKKRYVKQHYESYLSRKVTSGQIGQTNDRYHILPFDRNPDSLSSIKDDISKLIDAPDPITEIIIEIEQYVNQDSLIDRVRDWIIRGKPNEFEVACYTVLKFYLAGFGFKLHRFTSTNANDGGADYIGGDAVYCVTTQLTASKLESDIEKTFADKVFIHQNILDGKTLNRLSLYEIEDSGNSRVIKTLSALDICSDYLTKVQKQIIGQKYFDDFKKTLKVEFEKELQ